MQPLKNKEKTYFDNGRFEYIEIKGRGSYGEVYLVKHRQTRKNYAIKRYKNIFANRILTLRTLREIVILRIMNHSKVIKIFDIIPPKNIDNFNELEVVIEYLPFDLRKLCTKNKMLDDQHIPKIIYQLLIALKYLSTMNILHRDLKPQNILSDNDFNIKLCDFGLARPGIAEPSFSDLSVHEKPKAMMTCHVVSRWYRAPQIILMQTKYDASIEMWSVGCILGELIAEHKENKKIFLSTRPINILFDGKACFPLSPPKEKTLSYKMENGFPHSEEDQIFKILKFIGTPTEEDCSFIKEKTAINYLKSLPKYQKKRFKDNYNYCLPEWQSFLDKCLVFDPRKRITIDEAIKHPIFDKIRNQDDFNFEQGKNIDLFLSSDLSMQEITKKLKQQILYYQQTEMKQQL